MNKQMILGLLRHSLTAGGGGLVANGTATNDEWQAIVGGVVALVGLLWSLWMKRSGTQTTPGTTGAAGNIVPLGDSVPGPRGPLPAIAMVGLIGLLGLIGLGCKTFSSGATTEEKIAKIGNLAEVAAYTGAAIHLTDNPQHRVVFEGVIATLDALASTNNFDPVAFSQALQQLPIKELKSDKAAILIGTATLLYEMELRETVEVDRKLYVAAIAGRVRNGLARAVAQLPKPGANVFPHPGEGTHTITVNGSLEWVQPLGRSFTLPGLEALNLELKQ
jgi:hypothetical protein